MKKLLLASGVTIFALAGGMGTAHAVNISTADLVSICKDKGNAASQQFCNGYAQGVYDMYVSSIHPTKNPAYVCFPNPGPSREAVIDGYVSWASKVTEFNRLPAADSMMRYLATTYACKK